MMDSQQWYEWEICIETFLINTMDQLLHITKKIHISWFPDQDNLEL